jgi:hypothetical protein
VVKLYLHLHAYVMNCSHEQKFATFLINVPSNAMQTCLQLYASLVVIIWLLTHFTTPTFHLFYIHFFTTLYHKLSISRFNNENRAKFVHFMH